MSETGPDPWLGRFLDQDRRALREVESLVARIVSSRAFGIPPPDRQDLVQECLMQIWEGVALPGFDRGRSFEAFVRTVASRRCLDWRRVRRLTVALPADLPDGAAGPDAEYSRAQRAALGQALLAGLGAGCREDRLERCELVDLGGGGVKIGQAGGAASWNTGQPRSDEPDSHVSHILVRDCTIASGGRLHVAAVGVWIGHASHIVIDHNDTTADSPDLRRSLDGGRS